MDRVIVTGGVYKQFPNSADYPYHGIQSCLEFDEASGGWRGKQEPLYPRALGANLVILPTGRLMAVGGAIKNDTSNSQFNLRTPELFDPEGPSDLGTWAPLRPRYQDIAQPSSPFYPRNYHSCAILMIDGSVAVMGGRQFMGHETSGELLDPRDSVEVFRPWYTQYASKRPSVSDYPTAIQYQSGSQWRKFSVEVEKAPLISHACLIGVGAVTHHFDYGQRYLELHVKSESEGRLSVLPPASDTLAPPGYYMLFLVNDQGYPSDGLMVRLDY